MNQNQKTESEKGEEKEPNQDETEPAKLNEMNKSILDDNANNDDISQYVGKCQLCCKYKPGTFTKLRTVMILLPLTVYTVFDMQMLNVALYPISLYYNVSTTLSQWFVLIRSIANTVCSPFVPFIIGKLGYRKHMMFFCIPTAIGSIILPWCPFWLAMFFRVITSIGFAFLIPLASPSVRMLTNAGDMRKTLSITTIFQSISTALAPFLGGLFCDLPFGWRSIPYVSAGVMVIAFFVTLFCFPNIPRQPHKHVVGAKLTKNPNFDVIGTVTIILTTLTISLVFAIFSLVEWYVSVVLLGIGIVSFILFILHERRLESGHIFDPRVYRSKEIMCGFVVMSGSVMGTRVPNVLTPLVFQQVYGLSSTLTGLLQTIIMPVGLVLGGSLVPLLCKRFKPYIVLTVFMFLTGLVGIVMCLCFIANSWVAVFVLAIIFSIAVSFASLANAASILLAAPPALSAMIGALQTLIAAFAGGVGTTIAVTVRDVLTPVFNDPTNPVEKTGVRMGSLIAGSIISGYVLITGILSLCTKPARHHDGYQKAETTIQSSEIKTKDNEVFEVDETDDNDEIFVKDLVPNNNDISGVEGEIESSVMTVENSMTPLD